MKTVFNYGTKLILLKKLIELDKVILIINLNRVLYIFLDINT